MAGILRKIMRAMFPQCCTSCGKRLHSNEQYFCTSCMVALPRPWLGDDPYDNAFIRRFWGTLPVGGGVTVYSYFPGDGLTKAIHMMKYGQRADICAFMGRIMASDEMVARLLRDADALVPVPITSGRKKERGYNQCMLMCEEMSKISGVPVVKDALQRKKFTKSQTELSHQERAANIIGAFILADISQLAGRHVVIVDDIVTTGATMLECINTLSRVPDIKISIITLAWTSGHWG